jgi:hypothetical protein
MSSLRPSSLAKLTASLLVLAGATWAQPSFVCAPAFAQVAGSITGTVFDQNGMPLGGVKISARSNTQIGGAKVTYTASDGSFRLPSLAPGAFEIRATAPKLQELLQKNIQVGITSATDITLIMEVKSTTEQVHVVQNAPTVSTTAANVKTVFDLDYVSSLPIDGLATKVEPFVNANTPGAGAGGDRFRGGTNRQNQFMIEGFSMGNQRYTMKSLATIEAQTAAYGAEGAAAQGAMINMVTKSGSNQFEFDASAFYEDNRISPFRSLGDATAPVTRLQLNPGFSGPIIKDKLWFFSNLEVRHEYRGFDPDPAGFMPDLPPEQTIIGRGSFKLTWQVSPRNKLSSFTLYNKEAWSAHSDGAYDRDTSTLYNTPRISYFTGLTWESLLTDNFFYRAQVAIQADEDKYIPQNCIQEPVACLHLPPQEQTFPRSIKLQNYEQLQFNRNQGFEAINTLEWFPQFRNFGSHALKFVSRYWVKKEITYQGVPGDRKEYLNGSARDREVRYFANDPRRDGDDRFGYYIRGATGTLLVHSLSDSMKLARYVTVNAGVAFTAAMSETVAGNGQVSLTGLTPHLSTVWDATHDGRTVLRASFANYVDADAVRVSRYALGDQVARECKWDEASQSYNKECEYRGGAANSTFGLPCGPQGFWPDGRPCKQEIRLPRMWEYTLGAEREVSPGLSLSGDLIFRKFTHPYELQETNRIWNGAGSALSTSGGYRNGKPEQFQDLETSDSASRRYMGLTTVVRKREGRLRVQLGYTWSKLEGNVDNSGDNNPYADIAGRDVYLFGFLQDDHRHDIRGSAAYSFTNWMSVGTTYSYTSGAPYNRLFKNATTGKNEDYRARAGTNPGVDLNNPDDDRELRLPDVQRLNIKLNASLKPLTGSDIDVYVDILNILNMRVATAVTTDDGPNFGAVRTLTNPMLFRIGGRYRY